MTDQIVQDDPFARVPSADLEKAAAFIWHFSKIDGVLGIARARARRFTYDFLDDDVGRATVRACSVFFDVSAFQSVLVVFTRDLCHERGDEGCASIPLQQVRLRG